MKAQKSSEALTLEHIPNIGKALAEDLRLIGIKKPTDLLHQDGIMLYKKLMKKTGVYHDPCVADTFMAAVDFMNGGSPKKWWAFTKARKQLLGK